MPSLSNDAEGTDPQILPFAARGAEEVVPGAESHHIPLVSYAGECRTLHPKDVGHYRQHCPVV